MRAVERVKKTFSTRSQALWLNTSTPGPTRRPGKPIWLPAQGMKPIWRSPGSPPLSFYPLSPHPVLSWPPLPSTPPLLLPLFCFSLGRTFSGSAPLIVASASSSAPVRVLHRAPLRVLHRAPLPVLHRAPLCVITNRCCGISSERASDRLAPFSGSACLAQGSAQVLSAVAHLYRWSFKHVWTACEGNIATNKFLKYTCNRCVQSFFI